MNKKLISTAIMTIHESELANVILQGKQENEISQLIREELIKVDSSLQIDFNKSFRDRARPDLIFKKNNAYLTALEAKHYSTAQGKADSIFIKNAISGPIGDSFKLARLGFDRFFIVQYTSELIDIQGPLRSTPKKDVSDDLRFLRTYFFSPQGLNLNTIPKTNNSSRIESLKAAFCNTLDSELVYTKRSCKVKKDSSEIHLAVHFYIMEVIWKDKLTDILKQHLTKKDAAKLLGE